MRRRLLIACPQCTGSNSDFFKQNICSYCGSTKKVDILEHMKVLNISDERLHNVKCFIADPRFVTDYLEHNGKHQLRPRS